MSTVVEVLRRGRELYASAPSHVGDDENVMRGTYCPLTATLQAAAGLSSFGAMYAADNELRRAAGSWRLVPWNAENSTETVLEAWDRAIAAAEAKAMTTKAQDAVINAMADDGTVFVRPLVIGMTEYATVLACVLGEDERRFSPWTLIAEDGATMVLREDPNEKFAALDKIIMGASTEETT